MNALVRESLTTRVLYKENHLCGNCSELLLAHKPLYLLYVGRPHVQNGHISFIPEMTQEGEYEHWPYYFHQKCWEEVIESLNELNEDVPPALVEGTIAATCRGCSSHIIPGELCGVVYFGQLTLSDRAPSGEYALEMAITSSQYVCSVCMNDINLSILEGLWGTNEYIRQGNECPDGVQSRCWRYGECDPNSGRCHMKDG